VAIAGAIMLPIGISVRRRAHKKVHQRTHARIEQLFASDPPYSPFPATPDNSPLSLAPGNLTVRF
jgi:hypothetical protein